jgi:hypothetical protein
MKPGYFLLLLSACGSSPSTTPPDLTGAPPGDLTGVIFDLTGAPPGDFSTAYPAAPYGNNVGDTFPLLAWEGYPDESGDAVANTKTYGAYSSDSLRRSGRAYGLVHVSDFY